MLRTVFTIGGTFTTITNGKPTLCASSSSNTADWNLTLQLWPTKARMLLRHWKKAKLTNATITYRSHCARDSCKSFISKWWNKSLTVTDVSRWVYSPAEQVVVVTPALHTMGLGIRMFRNRSHVVQDTWGSFIENINVFEFSQHWVEYSPADPYYSWCSYFHWWPAWRQENLTRFLWIAKNVWAAEDVRKVSYEFLTDEEHRSTPSQKNEPCKVSDRAYWLQEPDRKIIGQLCGEKNVPRRWLITADFVQSWRTIKKCHSSRSFESLKAIRDRCWL